MQGKVVSPSEAADLLAADDFCRYTVWLVPLAQQRGGKNDELERDWSKVLSNVPSSEPEQNIRGWLERILLAEPSINEMLCVALTNSSLTFYWLDRTQAKACAPIVSASPSPSKFRTYLRAYGDTLKNPHIGARDPSIQRLNGGWAIKSGSKTYFGRVAFISLRPNLCIFQDVGGEEGDVIVDNLVERGSERHETLLNFQVAGTYPGSGVAGCAQLQHSELVISYKTKQFEGKRQVHEETHRDRRPSPTLDLFRSAYAMPKAKPLWARSSLLEMLCAIYGALCGEYGQFLLLPSRSLRR